MVFSFNYCPYVAIIGDIRNSKQLENRNAVQQQLKHVLDVINRDYKDDIASSFMITLGDEFQGLMKAGSAPIFVIDKIEREMLPVKIRFGIGVGEITTDINPTLPLGADGPAYYNARNSINALKASEKKKMESRLNIKIDIQDHPEVSELINTVFSLLTTVKETWTDRQTQIIHAYLEHGGTQEETAQILNINQSNVQKALSSASFYTVRRALESVAKVMSELGGDGYV